MKTAANIQFTGPSHRNSAKVFFDSLLNAKVEYKAIIFHDEDQEFTLVEINLVEAGDLKAQLHGVAQGLSKCNNWEFVGPRCKHYYEIKHKPHHAFMMNMTSRMMYGESWSCFELACRKAHGIFSESLDRWSLMTYREFNTTMHAVNSRPEPASLAPVNFPKDMAKPVTLGPDYVVNAIKNADTLGQGFVADTLNGRRAILEKELQHAKLRRKVVTALSYQMGFEKIVSVTGASREEVTTLIEEFKKNWPGIADYLNRDLRQSAKNMSFSDIRPAGTPIKSTNFMQQSENAAKMTGSISEALAKDLDKLAEGGALNISNERAAKVNELLHKVGQLEKQLDEWDAAILLPKDLVRKSDNLLRFLAGLNMQDHSIQDQRAFNHHFSELKKELERLKSEQFDGDKEVFDAWLRSDK